MIAGDGAATAGGRDPTRGPNRPTRRLANLDVAAPVPRADPVRSDDKSLRIPPSYRMLGPDPGETRRKLAYLRRGVKDRYLKSIAIPNVMPHGAMNRHLPTFIDSRLIFGMDAHAGLEGDRRRRPRSLPLRGGRRRAPWRRDARSVGARPSTCRVIERISSRGVESMLCRIPCGGRRPRRRRSAGRSSPPARRRRWGGPHPGRHPHAPGRDNRACQPAISQPIASLLLSNLVWSPEGASSRPSVRTVTPGWPGFRFAGPENRPWSAVGGRKRAMAFRQGGGESRLS